MGRILGRIIVGVKQSNKEAFCEVMKGSSITYLGETTDSDTLAVYDADDIIIEGQSINGSAWKGKLDMTGGVQ